MSAENQTAPDPSIPDAQETSPSQDAGDAPPAEPPNLPLEKLDPISILRSILVFVLAGVSEIGGGWLMWKSLRQGSPAWVGVLGGVVLALYGKNRTIGSWLHSTSTLHVYHMTNT
jgi:hypothetical protein